MAGGRFRGNAGSSADIRRDGAIVLAKLGLDPLGYQELVASGAETAPLGVEMLVDTGATDSFIEEQVVAELRLPAIGSRQVRMADYSLCDCKVYRALLEVPIEGENGPSMEAFPMRLLRLPAPAQRDVGSRCFQGILGRDFLEHFFFAYDGPSGLFELRLHR